MTVRSDAVPDGELDSVGLYCSMLFAQTKQEISKLKVGQVLKVEADDQAEGIDRLERSIHMDLMDMFVREDTGRRKERDKDSRSSAQGGRSGLCLCI